MSTACESNARRDFAVSKKHTSTKWVQRRVISSVLQIDLSRWNKDQLPSNTQTRGSEVMQRKRTLDFRSTCGTYLFRSLKRCPPPWANFLLHSKHLRSHGANVKLYWVLATTPWGRLGCKESGNRHWVVSYSCIPLRPYRWLFDFIISNMKQLAALKIAIDCSVLNQFSIPSAFVACLKFTVLWIKCLLKEIKKNMWAYGRCWYLRTVLGGAFCQFTLSIDFNMI